MPGMLGFPPCGQRRRHGFPNLGGGFRHRHPGLGQRGDLAVGGAFPAADDRAGVAHALAGGAVSAGDEPDHRLVHVC
jgi:hypothetical protein